MPDRLLGRSHKAVCEWFNSISQHQFNFKQDKFAFNRVNKIMKTDERSLINFWAHMLDESSHSLTEMSFESLLSEVFLDDESKKDIAYNAIVDYINKNHCKYYEQCKVIDENLLEISTKCAYKQYDDDADEPLFDIDGCNKDLKNRFGVSLLIDYDDLSQYSDNVVSVDEDNPHSYTEVLANLKAEIMIDNIDKCKNFLNSL